MGNLECVIRNWAALLPPREKDRMYFFTKKENAW